MARPTPIIGPISGEINMAPMMTAGEFTFRPIEAIMMAKRNRHGTWGDGMEERQPSKGATSRAPEGG